MQVTRDAFTSSRLGANVAMSKSTQIASHSVAIPIGVAAQLEGDRVSLRNPNARAWSILRSSATQGFRSFCSTFPALQSTTDGDGYVVMAYGVKLHVWGEYACFTRPEMKVERVSYDVMTPSAARGILEAVHWKPAIRWVIDRIHVLKPIRFENLRRNELGGKIPAGNVRKAMRSKDHRRSCTRSSRATGSNAPPLCPAGSGLRHRGTFRLSPTPPSPTTPRRSTWPCSTAEPSEASASSGPISGPGSSPPTSSWSRRQCQGPVCPPMTATAT